jgi:hypothetical protein
VHGPVVIVASPRYGTSASQGETPAPQVNSSVFPSFSKQQSELTSNVLKLVARNYPDEWIRSSGKASASPTVISESQYTWYVLEWKAGCVSSAAPSAWLEIGDPGASPEYSTEC